jgi:hypothetical protein
MKLPATIYELFCPTAALKKAMRPRVTKNSGLKLKNYLLL